MTTTDPSPPSAPEAGELARRLRDYIEDTRRHSSWFALQHDEAAQIVATLEGIAFLDQLTEEQDKAQGYLNVRMRVRAEQAEAKLAETEKQLATANAEISNIRALWRYEIALLSAATSGKGD
jgi:hypothetical protein